MKKLIATILTVATVYGIAPVALAGMSKTPWDDGSKPVISINNDAMTTEVADVTLSIHIVNADEMIVSNDGGFIGSDWQPYASEMKWKIWTDTGSQNVYVIFRNGWGTSDVYKDTIFYQTPIGTNHKSLQEWLAIANGSVASTTTTTTTAGTSVPAIAEKALPAGVNPGMLLKSKEGTIYYIGLDNKRHTYPNEKVYFTWNQGWGAVADASDKLLAQISLGKNMLVRPGTTLVKISSDPKVYGVDADGSLRWLTTSAVASSIYGANWKTKILDLNVTSFTDYKLGAPIMATEYLNGMVVRDSSGKTYKVDSGKLKPLTATGFLYNDYQERFVVATTNALSLPIDTTEITTWETGSLPTNTLVAAMK